MKNIIAVLTLAVAVPLIASPASSHELAVRMIGNQTLTKVAGQRDGNFGLGLGVDYAHEIAPHVAIGADLEYLPRPERESDVLPGLSTMIGGETLAALATARYSWGEKIRPFVAGGLGLASSHSTATASGPGGSVTLVDQTKTTWALSARAGYDVALGHLGIGLDVGYLMLGPTAYDVAGAQVKVRQSALMFGTRFAWRF